MTAADGSEDAAERMAVADGLADAVERMAVAGGLADALEFMAAGPMAGRMPWKLRPWLKDRQMRRKS